MQASPFFHPNELCKQMMILSKYSKHLICRICRHIFQSPVRLHTCGHTFCSKCVKHDYIKLCPRCDTLIVLIQNDLLASRLVADIKVKCTNDGCPWKGNYEQFCSFHKDKCSLKNGLKAWLENINQTINQRKYQVDSQSQSLNSEPRKMTKLDFLDPYTQSRESDNQQAINQQTVKEQGPARLVMQDKSGRNEKQQEIDCLFYEKYLPECMRTKNDGLSKEGETKKLKLSQQFLEKYFGGVQEP